MGTDRLGHGQRLGPDELILGAGGRAGRERDFADGGPVPFVPEQNYDQILGTIASGTTR